MGFRLGTLLSSTPLWASDLSHSHFFAVALSLPGMLFSCSYFLLLFTSLPIKIFSFIDPCKISLPCKALSDFPSRSSATFWSFPAYDLPKSMTAAVLLFHEFPPTLNSFLIVLPSQVYCDLRGRNHSLPTCTALLLIWLLAISSHLINMCWMNACKNWDLHTGNWHVGLKNLKEISLFTDKSNLRFPIPHPKGNNTWAEVISNILHMSGMQIEARLCYNNK